MRKDYTFFSLDSDLPVLHEISAKKVPSHSTVTLMVPSTK